MRFIQFILLIGLFAFSFANKNNENPCSCEKIRNRTTKQFCKNLKQNDLELIKYEIIKQPSGDTAIDLCIDKTRPADKPNCQNLVKFLKKCNN